MIPPEGFKQSEMTNGEARSMAAFISGYDPEDVRHFIVIVQLNEPPGSLKGTTDMCSAHTMQALFRTGLMSMERFMEDDTIDCTSGEDGDEEDDDKD